LPFAHFYMMRLPYSLMVEGFLLYMGYPRFDLHC